MGCARKTYRACSGTAIFLAVSSFVCAAELVAPHTAVFSDFPFDQWAAAPEHSAIKWDVTVLPPQLSVHQRLLERIQTVVPGSELAKRRGRGELVLITRFEDSDGRQWRAGSRINLAKVQAGVRSEELTFTTAAFVKPGDYKVLMALVDSQTMEHSFTHRTVHVSALHNDPLPDSWGGLPAVEVLSALDGPDAWFLPAVKGLLNLPVTAPAEEAPEITATARKVMFVPKGTATARSLRTDAPRVDLLINATPSEYANNPATAQRRNMASVIPAMKVLSGLNAKVRPPSAEVIDLMHHRIGFETANAATLDWNALSQALTKTNSGIIDAKSLSLETSTREYFANEVAKRAGDSGPERWLIVLSGPAVFARQELTPPPALAPDPHRHILYLRFTTAFMGTPSIMMNAPVVPGADYRIGPVQRVHGPMPGPPGRGGRGPGSGAGVIFPDDFENILKPMGAQIISITTPEAFRKTLASLIESISAAD
jgi:hypothetical protein